MAIDGGLRRLFKESLRHYHFQAIETGGTGLGVPDSNYCVDGIEGWIEYKKTDAWSVGLRPEQIGWHLKRSRAGGRTTIAVRRQTTAGPRKGAAVDELWLFPGNMVDDLDEWGIQRGWITNRPNSIRYHPTGQWDWDAIDQFLRR